jgi:hypothetical protein
MVCLVRKAGSHDRSDGDLEKDGVLDVGEARMRVKQFVPSSGNLELLQQTR